MRRSVLLITVMSICACCGCRSPSWLPFGTGNTSKREPIYTLAFHPVAHAAVAGGRLVARISGRDGENVNIRRIPLLTSNSIMFARPVVDASGNEALQVHLDSHGRYVWMQVAAQYQGSDLAVLVDGRYRFRWRVPANTGGQETIVVTGDWNSGELMQIARHATLNYKLLNQD